MLDLENLKLVLWDFDDTLCIHKYHHSNVDSEHQYMVDILIKGIDTWEDCSINDQMRRFMLECEEDGIKQGLISTCKTTAHANGKVDWVIRNYGVTLENYCVGTYEAKLDMMLALADTFGLERSEILIIDDFWENLERAANNGFMTCTPMEIVNYINYIGY